MKSKIIVVVLTFTISFCSFGQVRFSFPGAALPEEVVYAASGDSVINAGVLFHPKKDSAKPIAIIWVHGWGVNFYSPSYISIGRAFAEKGYTFISVNTRMHDLANTQGYKNGKRVRGGGYWGIASDQTKDIAAWIDFVGSNGFQKIILIGHSAGAAAVREYQSEKQDNRIAGLVLASGSVEPSPPIDSSQYIQALSLMAENKGEELIKDPKRSFPSYISAATFMDIANTPSGYKDFFGIHATNAGITKIHCPILAFYGTNGDIGNEKTLELLKSSTQKQSKVPISVTTTMIKGADHMYMGKEAQVIQITTEWIYDISKEGKK
ncbi:MAG: alpha/beta hydrolase [Chitinophagaceae bacterium]|nr:alpha/beta hydrolase [Chitinophagaceae bacterium]MCW5927125.1 alpha/beta hydrolase [Chitinophagaceae bacterium]